MDHAEAANPTLLAHYEGLVMKTSARYVGKTLHDFDDLCQIFRVKIWKALLAWDPRNPKVLERMRKEGKTEEELRDLYVFMCVRNQGKDLVKRRKPERDPLFIEDFAHQSERSVNGNGRESNMRDVFDARYLALAEEEVFGHMDGDVLLPGDLTPDERRVLVCMYLDYTQPETALRLGLPSKKVSAAVRSIKTKMKELAPSSNGGLAVAA